MKIADVHQLRVVQEDQDGRGWGALGDPCRDGMSFDSMSKANGRLNDIVNFPNKNVIGR